MKLITKKYFIKFLEQYNNNFCIKKYKKYNNRKGKNEMFKNKILTVEPVPKIP